MQFVPKLQQIEVRFEELTRHLADPALIADADRVSQSRQSAHRYLPKWWTSSANGKRRQRARAGARHAAGAGPGPAADGDGRSRPPGAGTGAHRAGNQSPAAAQRSQRRKERGAGNPRRHGRRRSHALRRRDLPHVLALRGIAALAHRSHLRQRIGGGRTEGSHRAGERRQGLQQAEVRERRAPRAARAGHRAAGPRAHFGHHRGGAAGSRRSGSEARSQGHPHRYVLLLRTGRPVREHHLFGGAHHAPAHRH